MSDSEQPATTRAPRITIDLTEEIVEAIEHIAAQEGTTPPDLVRGWVIERVQQYQGARAAPPPSPAVPAGWPQHASWSGHPGWSGHPSWPGRASWKPPPQEESGPPGPAEHDADRAGDGGNDGPKSDR